MTEKRDKMIITIIIPYFNTLDSTLELLNSIPNNPNIEIIIVDDKSEIKIDESLLRIFPDRRIIYLENKTNKKGAGTCRNIGIRNASGKWIIFADSDDLFVQDFYDLIEVYFSINYDVVFFPPTSKNFSINKISTRHIYYTEILKDYKNNCKFKNEIKIRYQFYGPWSKLIRREFLVRNSIYFDEVIASNDILMSAKIGYYMEKFAISDDTIYSITRRGGSLTTNFSLEIFQSRFTAFINYSNFLKKRLSKKELRIINLNGFSFIVNSVKYKFGIRCSLRIMKILIVNHISIFNMKIFNPYLLYIHLKKGKNIVN